MFVCSIKSVAGDGLVFWCAVTAVLKEYSCRSTIIVLHELYSQMDDFTISRPIDAQHFSSTYCIVLRLEVPGVLYSTYIYIVHWRLRKRSSTNTSLAVKATQPRPESPQPRTCSALDYCSTRYRTGNLGVNMMQKTAFSVY